MINKEFVTRKITMIHNDFPLLEELSKYSFNEIVSDPMKEAALERILEKIIMRAIDINQHIISEFVSKNTTAPKDYKETFSGLADLKIYPKEFSDKISKSVGTRNALAHEYDNINYNEVYSSMKDCLRDYHQYCQYILDFLKKK